MLGGSGGEEFESGVFINCPFDERYHPLLRSLLFVVVHLGFEPRIASGRSDSGESRIDKIVDLISGSKYSIHDLSRLRAAEVGEFYRMNMPFELGLDYGARRLGAGPLGTKRFLIMEESRYQFGRALSDLGGMDVESHGSQPHRIVQVVRNWFVDTVGRRGVESPKEIWYRFTDFTWDFYLTRKRGGFSDEDLNMMPVPEYVEFIRDWVGESSGRTGP